MTIAGPRVGQQLLLGEGTGGGDQHRRSVPAHLQRTEVARVARMVMPPPWEMPTGGKEVTRGAARRRHRIGLALADGVDVQAVGARGEHARSGRLHGDGGETAGELDGRRGDLSAVRAVDLSGQGVGGPAAAGPTASAVSPCAPRRGLRPSTPGRANPSRPGARFRPLWRSVRWGCTRSAGSPGRRAGRRWRICARTRASP